MNSWLQSYGGKVINPHKVDYRNVEMEDVAHALSMKCRFSGHCDTFYSVAEHTVRGSHLVPKEQALAFLLHEVDEVFSPDIPAPIKHLVRVDGVSWDDWVWRQELAILRALGLPHLDVHTPEIKKTDLQMLAWEQRDLMGPPPKDWQLPEKPPTSKIIHPWSPAYAEFRWIDCYNALRYGGLHEPHCEVRG
jgi:hypothetical protein